MTRTWPRPVRDAIRALADENAALHVATPITADDARAYLDDDVLNGFWVVQRAEYDAATAFHEALERLTDAEHATLQSALATGCNATVGRLISGVVRDHVAHWLASEAEMYRDTVPTASSPVAQTASHILYALTGDRA